MARGRKYEQETLYGPAIAEYQRALKENPENAEAHYRIGAISAQLGNASKAAEEFRQVLDIDPYHAQARSALASYHLNRGVIFRGQHQVEEAARELKEAVRMDPKSGTAYVELGQVYEETGRYQEAAEVYGKATAADSGSIPGHLHLGLVCNHLGQYARAVKALETVLRIHPDDPEAHAGLGVAYAQQGQRQQAKAAFAKAIRLYLIAGRRDLAQQVKDQADTLLQPKDSLP
jgi:tetratricopeptide (TPR) repeat protein